MPLVSPATIITTIRPTLCSGVPIYPCKVVVSDGSVWNRALFVDISRLVELGIPPFPDASFDLESVVSIADTTFRLPPQFADPIYAHGETSMGGFSIRLDFATRDSLIYDAGSIIDFPDLPSGYSMDQLIDAVLLTAPKKMVPVGTPARFKHVGQAKFEVAHFLT